MAPSATIAIAANFFSPAAMAEKTAVRSAQLVRPYDAFSTLHPLKILPDEHRRAAPTWKLE
jgi:hypothetical protein